VRAAVAALLVATACTSPGRPAPLPPAPSPTPPPLSTFARGIRAAAAELVAGCPCRVTIDLGAEQRDGTWRYVTVDGVWDAAAGSGEYTVRGTFDDARGPRPITLRIVRGIAYVYPAAAYGIARSRWARLDFVARAPRYATVFGMLAGADPGITFGALASVRGVARANFRDVAYTWGDEYVANAGPAGPVARAVFAPGAPYVTVDRPGTLADSTWHANGLDVTLRETRPGAARVRVAAPPGAETVDPFAANSLTAKRFGA